MAANRTEWRANGAYSAWSISEAGHSVVNANCDRGEMDNIVIVEHILKDRLASSKM